MLLSTKRSSESRLFCRSFLSVIPFVEVEFAYEKALEDEEKRITYQRKLLLLSIRKIRERENEMLIQAKNSKLNKRLASSEHELKSMQRDIEKQVSFKRFHALLRFTCGRK